MTLQVGYRFMIINAGKPLNIQNKMIQELTLIEHVINRVEHIVDQEGATEDI